MIIYSDAVLKLNDRQCENQAVVSDTFRDEVKASVTFLV